MSEIPARDKLKPALKLLFWIILIAALIAVASTSMSKDFKEHIKLDRWSRPLGSRNFIIIYILATILFIPGSLLTLGLG